MVHFLLRRKRVRSSWIPTRDPTEPNISMMFKSTRSCPCAYFQKCSALRDESRNGHPALPEQSLIYSRSSSSPSGPAGRLMPIARGARPGFFTVSTGQAECRRNDQCFFCHDALRPPFLECSPFSIRWQQACHGLSPSHRRFVSYCVLVIYIEVVLPTRLNGGLSVGWKSVEGEWIPSQALSLEWVGYQCGEKW